jgi:Chaperone of endosialidase
MPLTNWPAFFKLGVAKQIWIERRTLLPDVSFASFGPAAAGFNSPGEKRKVKTMYQLITFRATILRTRNSISRSLWQHRFLLVPLMFGCFTLSPTARAVTPAPDGGYPGQNTAEGTNALFSLTTGFYNTAIGFEALYSDTSAPYNTAVGANALYSNTDGFDNAANGAFALYSNTIGIRNTATGVFALGGNTTGYDNTATGSYALSSNTGSNNTATGSSALYNNTTGNLNTATGQAALYNNTTGSDNTANGEGALFSNESGSSNIALGVLAGANLTTGSNNIDIGNVGVAAESNTIRIGKQGTQTKTFIAGVSGAGVMGVAVKVNAAGQLGTAPSSARFKEQIKPMDKASEVIHALKPVTFRYKQELDREGIPQFGLVAEEVEKVNPDLVARDAEGKVYTVRYEAVNAMLLNEFLKEHRTVQEQQKEIDSLRADLKEQKELIQRVNDKVELNRAAPQTVLNNH